MTRMQSHAKTTPAALLLPEQKAAILHADHDDIFSVLGLHQWSKTTFVLRAFLPNADKVSAIALGSDQLIAELTDFGDGFFAGLIEAQTRFDYRWRVHYGEHVEIIEDPYRFGSMIGETDLYLFGEGTHEQLYRVLGAHLTDVEGVQGTRFCVWAPNARRVSVVGQFNYWDGRRHIMRKHIPSGVWEIFIPGVGAGDLYKYEIKSAAGHVLPQKSDPYGFSAQHPPETASCVVDIDRYQWSDGTWMRERGAHHHRESAISIYEVHLGSWRRVPEEGNRYLTYRELAEQLIPYVKSLNFTHIQLMPISEFPFDGSWGYQPIGLYAPTSRFGSPDDFKHFIDCCHQAGLGVLIDWVPGHFPSDAHGLAQFDGTPLFEHADHRQGFHPDWNTFIFNYGRHEVANYLFANALFWLQEYHIDGLRVDAVASMLYLDYSRNQGEWVPNQFGGRENLEAIDLIKRVNQKVYERFPDIVTVAEESTAWPGVSHPVYAGGLGFGFKWNMGWMNDTLRYMSKDPIHRQYHHHDLTFSLIYAFNENFILPLSHDEVVHGKRSLLGRMPGSGDEQFANLRAYLAYMWSHPGKKLLFMGGEFAQGREWDHDASLDWHQLDMACHQGVQRLVADLNALYIKHPALFKTDCEGSGFQWIEADDRHNSVFSYVRRSEGSAPVIAVVNMTPVFRQAYRLGVPEAGYYRELINTDAACYGGSDLGNEGGVQAQQIESHGRTWSIDIVLPPLATVIFELQA